MTKAEFLNGMTSVEISERLALDRIHLREREAAVRKAKQKRRSRR